jgi:GMP synthase PP-ATPase subunit
MVPDAELTELAHGIVGPDVECFRMSSRTTVVPEEGTRPEIPIYKPVSWVVVQGEIDFDRLEELCRAAWTRLELPRVLLQLHENQQPRCDYVVGMRIVESAAAKEARPVRFEPVALMEMSRRIAGHSGASRVAYDISHKPPATIEFE